MKTLIIYNHPHEGSFCSAIREAVHSGLKKGGHPCKVINLDKDQFDPVMRGKDLKAFVMAGRMGEEGLDGVDPIVLRYMKKLHWAEHIVMIFPVWWMLMPALTKGFIDKVIFPAVAYGYTAKGEMRSRLDSLRRVTLITTMSSPSEVYGTLMGDAVWRAFKNGTFTAIGVDNCRWMNFDRINDVTRDKRLEWLRDVEEYFATAE